MVTKWLTIPLALLCVLAGAQTPAVPTTRPHQNFVDNSGNPCALCTLSSFAAGTTTPQPTFTDSTGGTQNTNPIVLDVAGGANIWLTPTLLYKFVLKDALGNTIWTVDNVPGSGSGGGSLPCSTSFAVQIANNGATALTCDPNITIDTTAHSLDVGGVITGPAFTLKNLSTITSSWTFDVTTPNTALNSLGAIPLPNLATQAPDTVVMNAGASTVPPTAVAMPSGCTLGVNYSTTSHTWSCAASTIPLSKLASQAADTVVMNPTGSSAPPIAQVLPSGCANGINYSTSSHAWSCVSSSTPAVCSAGNCYRVGADGTTEEWGTLFCGSNSCTISFPLTFPSTTNLSFQVGTNNGSQSNLVTTYSSLSSSNVVVTTEAVVFVGGAGTTYGGGSTYSWYAIQHN